MLEDRPSLQAGPGEAVLTLEYTGICGTDLALYSGDYPVPLPLVLGHEFVGRVESIGEGVDPGLKGRRVVGEINNTCLACNRPSPCRACRTGLANHCQCRTVTGIIQKDGSYAQELVLPAGTLHPVPEKIDPLTAVLTEPLAAALQTFEMSPAETGETVVVLGPGRLGILITFVAAQLGLKVLAVSRSDEKRQRALKFGAAAALPPMQADSWIREQTEGLGADRVVDATGTPEGITQALALVRPRGVISAKTTCGLPAGGLDMTGLVVNEVRIQGSRCGPFAPALDLLQRHQDLLKTLITREFPLTQVESALAAAQTEPKVVLHTRV
jgi:threonine dehydrogenase-like Zn-dependent dehydrogenase